MTPRGQRCLNVPAGFSHVIFLRVGVLKLNWCTSTKQMEHSSLRNRENMGKYLNQAPYRKLEDRLAAFNSSLTTGAGHIFQVTQTFR